MSNEKQESAYNPGRAGVDAIKKLQLEHTTVRLQMCLQYGVLAAALCLIVFLSLRGKMDSTVSALVATLLGYVLRSTKDRYSK